MTDARKTEDRFWDKVSPEPNSGCWLWTGAIVRGGYGQFFSGAENNGPRLIYAHRYSYELAKGRIPENLTIDHLCRVRCCVNPAHLEAVPFAENIKRGTQGHNFASRTHCPKGHPFDGENLRVIVRPNGQKARHCKACAVEATRRWRGRHSA